MFEFLSEEWLTALGERVAAIPGGSDREAKGGSLALGQIVTGAPAGDVSYTIQLGRSPGVIAGLEPSEVVIVETFETARALAAGELSASDAHAAGRIKVRGHAGRLVESNDLLAGLAAAVAGLRDETRF